MEKTEKFMRENAVPLVVAAVVALVVVAAVGAVLVSAKSGDASDAKAEVREEQARIAGIERERDVAERRAEAVVGQRERILSSAEAKASKLIGTAKTESEEAENKLVRLESEAETASSELSEVESSLEGAEHTKELSSFGDGIWKAEVDFVPGTYRAPGGGGCYWATLNSADPYDIASNENGVGSQIASIHTPYFQTKGCGTWERIGE